MDGIDYPDLRCLRRHSLRCGGRGGGLPRRRQRRRRCCSRSRGGQRHRAASELDRRRRLRARAFPEWRGRAHRLLRRDAGQGTAGACLRGRGSPRPLCSSMGQVSTRPLGGCGGGAGRSEGLGGSARTAREAHARGDARTGREARDARGSGCARPAACGSRSPKRSCGLPTRRERTSTTATGSTSRAKRCGSPSSRTRSRP